MRIDDRVGLDYLRYMAGRENFYKKIGRNVKKYRENKGLTQMELAHAIGHNSVGHIAKAELYKYGKHFNLEQLYKISKFLTINISQLIEG